MGYGVNLFVEEPEEDLMCPICCDVFRDPVHCKNGHTFCNECIIRWLEKSKMCPIDKGVISDGILASNIVILGIINNLEVYCQERQDDDDKQTPSKSTDKCGWTGKLRMRAKHIETCPFQQVHCPNVNCNTTMQRRDLQDHDRICRYKKVECDEQCGVTLIRRDLPNHKRNECSEVRLSCPNGCRTSVVRKNINTHREICSLQQVQCPNVNCNANKLRRELEDHDKICKYKKMECEKCRAILIRHELQVHKDLDCPEEMVPCPNDCTCSKGFIQNLRRYDLKNHLARECGNTRLQCPFKEQGCNNDIFRKDLEKHLQEYVSKHMLLVSKQSKKRAEEILVLSNRFEELSERMKKALDDLSTFVWRIHDYPALFRKHSGSYFRSPNFWLCGHSWFIELYPNGEQDKEGFLSLNLCLNEATGSTAMSFAKGPVIPSVKTIVCCRFSVISHNTHTEDATWSGNITFSKEKTTVGRPQLMKATSALSTDFCTGTDGILIVKCTIQLL